MSLRGETPLMAACRAGDACKAKELIDAGENLEAQNPHGETAMVLACRNSLWNIVKLCWERNENIRRVLDNNQDSILKLLCRLRKEDLLLAFLKGNEDIFEKQCIGLIACEYRLEELTFILMCKGINRFKQNGKGETFRMLACKYQMNRLIFIGTSEKRQYEIRDHLGRNFAMYLIEYYNQDIIMNYLSWFQHKMNLNARDKYGNTLVMLACRRKYVNVVEKLLESGVKLNIQNCYGETLLIKACKHRLENIALKCIEMGVNPMVRGFLDGKTAMRIAFDNRMYAVVDAIMKHSNL